MYRDQSSIFHCRVLGETDICHVLEIEADTEATGWSEGLYRQEFRAEGARVLGVFCSSSTQLVGFLAARRVLDEVFVYALAVRRQFQRQSAGSTLLEALISEHPSCWVTLEVRASNQAARRFYARHGFEQIGVRSQYYRNPVDDALVLSRFCGPEQFLEKTRASVSLAPERDNDEPLQDAC